MAERQKKRQTGASEGPENSAARDASAEVIEDYFLLVGDAEEDDAEAPERDDDTESDSLSDSVPGPFSGSPYEHLDVALDVRFEYDSAPQSGDPVVHALVQISPEGQGLVDRFTGPVCHLVLALDLSASMDHDDKFPVLMDAVRTMLLDLQDPESADVIVSFVAFGMGAEVLLRDTPARRLDPRDFVRAVFDSELLFTRYTDIGGALRRAGRLALDSHLRDRRMPVRIVVLTDGQPQDMPGSRAAMEAVRKIPVDVDCLAFGDDADVGAMKKLLCGGRGGTVKQVMRNTIGTAFGRVGQVAQRVVAKRALVDLELRPDVLGGAAYRYRPGRHSFGDRAFGSGHLFHTDLGTLESDRVYQLLFQLRLPETDDAETEIGRLAVRVPGDGGPCTFEKILSLPRHAGSEPGRLDEHVRKAVDILAGEDHGDIDAKLRSLETRRDLLVSERRDSRVIATLDKAIEMLREKGSLDEMSPGELAAMSAHTRTVALSPRARRKRE